VEVTLVSPLLTYRDAAKILNVSQNTVETLSRVRKQIPIVRVGNSPRIRLTDLLAYIDRSTERAEINGNLG